MNYKIHIAYIFVYLKKIIPVDLQTKVLVLPNICGIEIDLSATLLPTSGTSMQSFYNTVVQNSAAVAAYATPSKIRFSESGKETRAGHPVTQVLSLQFPLSDPLRALRVKDYLKVKYIYIRLSSNMVFLFGRNDFQQNSAPAVEYKSTEKTAQVIYTCKSWFPIGFTNGSWDSNLPGEFPLNFFNLL